VLKSLNSIQFLFINMMSHEPSVH